MFELGSWPNIEIENIIGPMGISYFPILLIWFFPTQWSTTPRKKKELKQHKIFHRVFIINLIVTQTISIIQSCACTCIYENLHPKCSFIRKKELLHSSNNSPLD